MLERVIAIATCPSVRPSVCLSVTRRYCVKTKKASVMISSPSGSPKTLVFWRQISSPNSKGFPPNEGLKNGRLQSRSPLSVCIQSKKLTVVILSINTMSKFFGTYFWYSSSFCVRWPSNFRRLWIFKSWYTSYLEYLDSGTGSPIDFVFDSRVFVMEDWLNLFPVAPNQAW